MKYHFYLSKEDKEQIYHTDLLEYGIKSDKAGKIAKTLASNESDKVFSEEEKQLVTNAYKECLNSYNKYKNLQ